MAKLPDAKKEAEQHSSPDGERCFLNAGALAATIRDIQIRTLKAAAEKIHDKHVKVVPEDAWTLRYYNTGMTDAETELRVLAAELEHPEATLGDGNL